MTDMMSATSTAAVASNSPVHSDLDANDDDDQLYAALVHTSPVLFLWLWASCLLSLLGSGAILYHLYGRQRQRKTHHHHPRASPQAQGSSGTVMTTPTPTPTTTVTLDASSSPHHQSIYHSIVAGISVADGIGTIGYATAVCMVPRASGLAYALGNTTTCQLSGVLQTGVIAPFVYTTELSLYFLVRVRYGWSEQAVTQRMMLLTGGRPGQGQGGGRQWMLLLHIVPWGCSILVAVLGVTMDVIHVDRFTGVCDLGPTPPGCTTTACDNGDAIAILFPILSGVLLVSFLGGVVATWLVCRAVRQQTNRSLRYSLDTIQQQRRKHDMTVQAVLYTLALSVMLVIIGYANTWGDAWSERRLIVNRCIYHVCVPLQGTFNFIIYFRLRIRAWHRKNRGHRSWAWAVYQAVVGGTPTTVGASSSSSEQHAVGLWSSASFRRSLPRPHWATTFDSSSRPFDSPMAASPKEEEGAAVGEEREDTTTTTQSPSKSSPGDEDVEDQQAAVEASSCHPLPQHMGDLPLPDDGDDDDDAENPALVIEHHSGTTVLTSGSSTSDQLHHNMDDISSSS